MINLNPVAVFIIEENRILCYTVFECSFGKISPHRPDTGMDMKSDERSDAE